MDKIEELEKAEEQLKGQYDQLYEKYEDQTDVVTNLSKAMEIYKK